ncbi:MAG TPA: rRNA methyltransferase, partial [Deltaproteobacteria bacterium]|nr:rRNA methyltransferase [Deltaproteobacteria bacterium]
MKPLQRYLHKFLLYTTWRPWLTIAIAFCIAFVSIFYTVKQLDFETSQLDLISPENRLIKLSDKLDQFRDLNPFTVVIEAPTPERAVVFLNSLVNKLNTHQKYFKRILYRVDWQSLKKWSLLYLDKDELETLRDNLSDHLDILQDLDKSPDLENLLFLINREMTSKMLGHFFTDFLEDNSSTEKTGKPLDLTYLINILSGMNKWIEGERIFKSPWSSFFGNNDWEGELDSYFWTSKKKFLLLFVTPRKFGSAFTNKETSLRKLREIIRETQAAFPDVDAGVTGQEALNTDQMTVGLRDMSIASALSLVALTLLLILFWKSVRKPLLEITELLLALSWTFGLTTLFIGHLNILSMIFAPLLLGLGIDYGIHWLARYEEALKTGQGSSTRETIVSTMSQIGPAVLVAGLTAAMSFLPLALTNFRGLKELGIISAMGMVMTTITTLGVLPSLVLVFDSKKRRPAISGRKIANRVLMNLTPSRCALILSVSFVLVILSAAVARNVKFDLNLLQLQPEGTESVDWEMKLLRNSKRSALFAVVLANTPEEVHRKMDVFKKQPTVAEVESIYSFLPENQKEKLPLIRKLKPLVSQLPNLSRTRKDFDLNKLDEILGSIRFKMLPEEENKWGANKPIEDQMIQVRTLISKIKPMLKKERYKAKAALLAYQEKLFDDLRDKLDTIKVSANVDRPMTVKDLPRYLHDQYIGEQGQYLIRIYPRQNVWEADSLEKFVKNLQAIDPDVIGDPVTLYVFTRAFRKACIQAAIYAVFFIFGLLLFTFRSLANSLLAMIPLIVGTLWTTGLMWCLGVDFNLANSLFLPLIVGAGVEYGIVILNRWFQEKRNFKGLPLSTGKGIILAALTTTVGFGSLMISHHRGIY